MTYYLDSDFRLHLENDGTMQQWEDVEGFFDGMPGSFVEGYRVVPEGQTWVRNDGRTFGGLMITPAVPMNQFMMTALKEAADESADKEAALALLGVTIDEPMA